MQKPISSAIVSINSFELSDEEKRLFAKHNPLGFCLFARNLKNKTQIQKLIKEIKETLERDDIIISLDQEGGRVRRLVEPDFQAYLPQSYIGEIYKENKELGIELAKTHAYLISKDLIDMGFTMNFAPVLDIMQNDSTPAIRSRCFSNNEEVVATLGKVIVDEYIKNGISPCIKHLPGHGRAIVDPHLHLPIINASKEELEKDFHPFIKTKYAPSGMTAHIILKEFDDKKPITQSKTAIDNVIRGIIGFDGLLISDAIDMKALKGTTGEKAIESIHAGCDVVCYASGIIREMEEMFVNIPKLSEKSLTRVEKLKHINNQEKNAILEKNIIQYQEHAKKTEVYKDSYDATEVINLMLQK